METQVSNIFLSI